ncbi:MAG: hypothetical protein PUE33_02275 [bacterium]|nr:hypothetical protein [Mycoplasmatota bacterium]MDD6756875.1 hypothetical protein [bacterium]MDY2907999.1 hypothetical protein [Candidatus Faecimonas sp.]
MKIIEDLKNNISNENEKLVFELANIIIDNKITTLDELKKLEDSFFTYNGKVLSDEERINYCMEMIKYSSDDYDLLTFEEIQEYKKLKNQLYNSIADSNKQKIRTLIMIFSMTKRDMMFLIETYNWITYN